MSERLRLMRESRDLSLSKLGEASGISKAYLVRLERGDGNPTLKLIVRLAEALGCSPAWLAFGRPDE